MKTIVLSDALPKPFSEHLRKHYCLCDDLDNATTADRQGAVGVVVYGHRIIDAGWMDRCPNLRVISNHGVGVDHIDLQAATDRGIAVGNTPGCLDDSTADMTLALMLAVARNVMPGNRYALGPEFTHYDPAILIGQEVSGATLGIVGMGRIGLKVAERARAFGMRILYHNRRSRPDVDERLGTQHTSLQNLLSQSDFVSLNCPLSDDTASMIDADALKLMKPNAILLNLARGPVVNTQDLYHALRKGEIAGAGLDVTDPEPLPRDHPLLELDNVLITPHLGSASDRTRQRMMEMTIANLDAGISGKTLPARAN